jgi:hypothetical protein
MPPPIPEVIEDMPHPLAIVAIAAAPANLTSARKAPVAARATLPPSIRSRDI